MKRFYTLAIAAIAVIGLALFATPASAVHKGAGDLTCGACHTMHSSQGGTNAPGMGGATGSWLLLRASVTSKEKIGDFCLSCHAENGTGGAAVVQNPGVAGWETTPPKVYRTTAWSNGDFTAVGAGGDFNGSGDYSGGVFTNDAGDNVIGASLGKGHSINLTTLDQVPPGSNTGAGGIENFTCTTCHDPHGVSTTTAAINKYRNLRGNIADGGNGIPWDTSGNIATSYVGAVAGSATGGTNTTLANNVWPVYRNAGSQNSYGGSATAGLQFSRFCAQCHGDWHEETETGNGIKNWALAGNDPTSGNYDWQRHPVDAALVQAPSLLSTSGVTIVDKGHYDATYGNLALGRKLPAANNGGSAVYYGDNDGDKVFCLSCHFAHGSPNFDILRWSHTSAVEAGSQAGNAIPSDTGCQQCHNRGGAWGL